MQDGGESVAQFTGPRFEFDILFVGRSCSNSILPNLGETRIHLLGRQDKVRKTSISKTGNSFGDQIDMDVVCPGTLVFIELITVGR